MTIPSFKMSSTPVQRAVPPSLAPSQRPRLTIEFSGPIDPPQRILIQTEILSWPPVALDRLAPGGYLEVLIQPESLAAVDWRPGQVTLRAVPVNEERLTFQILLEPIRRSLLAATLGPDRSRQSFTREPGALLPLQTSLLKGTVARIASQGLLYHPSPYFEGELALRQIAKETGGGSHQLRFRFTNPQFNRWVANRFVEPIFPFDPGLKFYAGIFGAVATDPFAVVGTFAWGTDAQVTLIGQYELFLDANLQHRIRSGIPEPTDGVALEVFPRLQSPDRHLTFGLSLAAVAYPEPSLRGSLVGRYLF